MINRIILICGFIAIGLMACAPEIYAVENPKVGAEQVMNERIQNWLANTLESLTTTAEKAADFASVELPLFVQEFIMYHMMVSWIAVIFSIIGFIIWIFFLIVLWRHAYRKRAYDWEFGPTIITIASIVFLGIPLSGILLSYFETALMSTFAPRVFLVTEFLKFFK